MTPIVTKLVGVKFGNCQENIKLYGCPDINTYELRREINNKHDPNAIRVTIGTCEMGYLSRHVAEVIAPMMDVGRTFMAEFVSRNVHPWHETVGMTVRIVEITRQNKTEPHQGTFSKAR